MIEISISKGKYHTYIDEEDFDTVMRYKWRILKKSNTSYVHTGRLDNHIFLHRLITKAPKGVLVDHIDKNGLNNCKNNLRLCDTRQNVCYSKNFGKIPYKGVYFKKTLQKYVAQIAYKGHKYHLGCFNLAHEAALVYDKKAKELHGEFAQLNFPLTISRK
jgi:hypothetical protein